MEGLKNILKEKGLKHVWLAEKLGFDKAKMSRIMNGNQEASKTERFMMCHVLECKDEDLD